MNIAGSFAAMVLGTLLWLAISAHGAAAADCSAAGHVTFICGVTNVEDFAPAPDTKWVIGSDLSTASNPQGYLYLFDTGKKTASAVPPSKIAIRPDKKTYPGCPGPVDMKTFRPHGLDLTRSGGHAPHTVCRQPWRPGIGGSLHRRSVEIQACVYLEGVRACTERLLA
jgi:hypothetical protein